MVKRWSLAATTILVGCSAINPLSHPGSLILKPQITAGSFHSQSIVDPYTQSSIHHLILKLYTYDGAEHNQGIQKTLSNAQLDNPIAFSNLKNNTTYRIKAFAYATNDESVLISTTDGSSDVDIPLSNEDRPTIATLRVKLIDRVFNGQASSSSTIFNGGFSQIATETMRVPKWVSTFAGTVGTTGYQDAVGTIAKLNSPVGIAADSFGNTFFTDSSNQVVRKITPGGVVSTFVGGAGLGGWADGVGTAARFSAPYGLAFDAAGNMYVADLYNQAIRKVSSTGTVTTLAGSPGASGSVDGTGTAARFWHPHDIAVDGAGNLYVTDNSNHAIRKVTSAGVVTTYAGALGVSGAQNGTGTAARFAGPLGITIDGAGNLYVGDRANHLIQKITPSRVVTTLAGQAGVTGCTNGSGTTATFNAPWGVAIGASGNLYVSDRYNNAIREITPDGVVSTLAGIPGTAGSIDGIGTQALFKQPLGLTVDIYGNILVVDNNNQVIRIIR